MAHESITQDAILSEIIAYIDRPDLHAEGWRTTSEIAEAMGLSVGVAAKRLEKALAEGGMEKVLDQSRRAWWRVKA